MSASPIIYVYRKSKVRAPDHSPQCPDLAFIMHGARSRFHYPELGKAQQQLFDTHIFKGDSGLGIYSLAFYGRYHSVSKTVVLYA